MATLVNADHVHLNEKSRVKKMRWRSNRAGQRTRLSGKRLHALGWLASCVDYSRTASDATSRRRREALSWQ